MQFALDAFPTEARMIHLGADLVASHGVRAPCVAGARQCTDFEVVYELTLGGRLDMRNAA